MTSHWHSSESPVLSLVRTSILAYEQITQDSFSTGPEPGTSGSVCSVYGTRQRSYSQNLLIKS